VEIRGINDQGGAAIDSGDESPRVDNACRGYKTPTQRMQDAWRAACGITPRDLEAMTPEEKSMWL